MSRTVIRDLSVKTANHESGGGGGGLQPPIYSSLPLMKTKPQFFPNLRLGALEYFVPGFSFFILSRACEKFFFVPIETVI